MQFYSRCKFRISEKTLTLGAHRVTRAIGYRSGLEAAHREVQKCDPEEVGALPRALRLRGFTSGRREIGVSDEGAKFLAIWALGEDAFLVKFLVQVILHR